MATGMVDSTVTSCPGYPTEMPAPHQLSPNESQCVVSNDGLLQRGSMATMAPKFDRQVMLIHYDQVEDVWWWQDQQDALRYGTAKSNTLRHMEAVMPPNWPQIRDKICEELYRIARIHLEASAAVSTGGRVVDNTPLRLARAQRDERQLDLSTPHAFQGITDSDNQPRDAVPMRIGTHVSLGAWDIIGIFTGVPLAAWIGLGLMTRTSRGRRFESALDEAKSLEELNQIAAEYETALMWKMLGPHQGLRLERMRTEIERDKFADQLKSLPDIKTDAEPLTVATSASSPAPTEASGPPDASVEAQKTDEKGYEWYTSSDGKNWYRTQGSNEEWVEFSN